MSRSPVLKGSSFTFSILQLFEADIDHALAYLQAKTQQAPSFFMHAPLVVDIGQVTGDIDYQTLNAGIEALHMRLVGVCGWRDDTQRKTIYQVGLAAVQSGIHCSLDPSVTVAKQASKHATHKPAQVVKTPIRSGQQVYARERDLIVFGTVSNGAEVIADGSVHVLGALRGRAIAGAQGNPEAQIICHNLQAELCSVAGTYWLSEQIESIHWQQSVVISKQQDSLHIEALKL